MGEVQVHSVFTFSSYFASWIRDASRQFEVVRIANPDKVAIIESVGVKRVDLEIDIAEATAAELIEGAGGGGIWNNITESLGDAFKAITSRDETVEQIR